LALHEQQKQAIENADDFDEIVIPALEEGYPGLTRTDLIELHEQQRLAIENVQNWDQIVIPASEDGYPGLTWDEVATIQEQQADEISEMAADPYDLAAPYPEDGGPDMTVQDLKNLHMKQSVN
jgi:malate/lactate dehydrogenase